MKYKLNAVCLFFIFSFVLNSSIVQEFKDGEEKLVKIIDEELYLGIKVPKSGAITLHIEIDQKLESSNFKYGLYPYLNKYGPIYYNDITLSHIGDLYTITFLFEKGDNEYAIIYIGNLIIGKKAKIQIIYFTNFETGTITFIGLVFIILVIIIIICICKKIYNSCS